MRLLAGVLGMLSSTAFAQTRPDLEYRDTEVDQKTDKLTVRGFFESHYYEYNNLDFRARDESSDQAILDSDDRGALAFTGAQVEVGYQIDPQLRFVVTGSHRGLWGDDQIGETNEFGGFIYFPALYLDMYTKPDNDGVRFRVGRQFYTLGGLGKQVRDYVLADVLDMVRIDIPVGTDASWTLVPINVFSTASPYDDVDFVSLIGQQNPSEFAFRGEVLTRRFGSTFQVDGPDAPFNAQAYTFFTDFHGRGSGGDISFNGLFGNFDDNDYVVNYGLRGSAEIGAVRPFFEFAGSAGVDRKELDAVDISNSGFAWGAGLRVDTQQGDNGAGALVQLRYFESQGASYGSDGLQTSHGYVGMKAQQVGGTLFNRFLGIHPTAYAGRSGIVDNPQDPARKAGLRTLEAFGGYQFDRGFRFLAGAWLLQDTGTSDVDFDDIDSLELPFGYSRVESAATERFGRVLGTELNLDVGWQFGPYVEAFARGAVIVPGTYYELVIDRTAGLALGSTDQVMPWALQAGTRVSF